MLRLGLEAMKELVDSGDVPAVRLNQKHTVMLREDLIDFLRREGRRQAAERKQRKTQLPPCGRQLIKRAARRPRPPDLRPYEVD